MVPEDKWLEAGMDPSAVKVQKSQGGGFLTNVEVLHHVHCLVSHFFLSVSRANVSRI